MALRYQRHRTPLEDDWCCKPSIGGAIFIIPNIFGVYRYTWFMIGIATLWLNTPSLLRPIMPSASFGFFSEPMLLGWFAIPRPWQWWIPKGKSSSEPISGSVYVTWKKRAFLPHRIHVRYIYMLTFWGIFMVNDTIYRHVYIAYIDPMFIGKSSILNGPCSPCSIASHGTWRVTIQAPHPQNSRRRSKRRRSERRSKLRKHPHQSIM